MLIIAYIRFAYMFPSIKRYIYVPIYVPKRYIYVPFPLKVKVQYQEPALIGYLIFKLKERPVGGLSFGGDEVIARNRAVKSAV